jgi:hypothetical protein
VTDARQPRRHQRRDLASLLIAALALSSAAWSFARLAACATRRELRLLLHELGPGDPPLLGH